jgi:nitrogen fixation/metabolism regulation signal transduction histidine kinase
MIEIAVSDTGSGVGDDVMQSLFQTFFTTKETGMGVGRLAARSLRRMAAECGPRPMLRAARRFGSPCLPHQVRV